MILCLTTCDKCNPDSRHGSGDSRGWFDGSREAAMDSGWVRRNRKDICPECLDEEDVAKEARSAARKQNRVEKVKAHAPELFT